MDYGESTASSAVSAARLFGHPDPGTGSTIHSSTKFTCAGLLGLQVMTSRVISK